MHFAISRLAGWMVGTLSIVLGVFNWWWIFYASEASLHMGSPLRRHPAHALASLTGNEGRAARDSHSTGLILIDVLGNTFWVMFVSGAFLILVGLLVIFIASRFSRSQRMTPESSVHSSLHPDPHHGSS